MCGGIRFEFGNIPEAELLAFLLPEELAAFKKMSYLESFFWARRPILPAILAGRATHLYDWGNREKNVDLPQTGWAKIESIESGRWKYLHPQEVIIPAVMGYEKKVWFEITAGLAGILIQKDDLKRVYMITETASPAYQAKTGHNRMPKFV